MAEKATPLKSLDMALSLLKHFTIAKPNWGVRELAKHVGKHPSVIQRSLTVLESHSMLRRTTDATYGLGHMCIELGKIAEAQMNLGSRLEACLRPVVNEIRLNLFFYRAEHDEAVCSFVCEDDKAFDFSVRLGHRLQLHDAPFSQIILAHKSESDIEDYIQHHEISDGQALIEQLKVFKNDGYGYSKEVLFRGTHGIAVPVFNLSGEVVGALCAAAILTEENDDIFNFVKNLKAAAMEAKGIF